MLISILWIIILVFQYLQCTLTSQSPNFSNISFFESSDDVTIVRNERGVTFRSSADVGDKRRIFGIDNDTTEITFNICAPKEDCRSKTREIQLCYFNPTANKTTRDGCGRYFCSIRFKFIGQNDTHMNVTISTKYADTRNINILLPSSLCISGHLTLFQKENVFRASTLEQESIRACGLSSVPFKNSINNIQNQTALYLRGERQNCEPIVTLQNFVDEYFKAPTPSTTTTFTTSELPATIITSTSTEASSTAFNVKQWIHIYWWGPILGALILITITLFLCVLSCIFRSRSAARVNKLYRNVLIRRHERKKRNGSVYEINEIKQKE